MKAYLVKLVRGALPKSFVFWLTRTYRRLRLAIVSLWYGYPAKHLKFIAATGTNGKTTTLCLLNEVLKTAGYRTALFTTAVIELNGESRLNDSNTTVASTAEMQRFFTAAKDAEVDYVLLEVTSHALDQFKLPKLNLEVAIFTNLTQDHLDYHKDMDEYAFAKSKLWHMEPRFSVVNVDSDWFEYFAQFSPQERLVTYGAKSAATFRIAKAALYRKGSDITVEVDDKESDFGTQLPGRFNVYNAVAAMATATCLGVDAKAIHDGIAQLSHIPGRQETVANDLGLDIIVDYAHTPDALEQLLDYARTTSRGTVSLVFGACGDRDQTKRPIMGRLAAQKADRLFVTDEENYTEEASVIRQMIIAGIQEIDPNLDKAIEIPDRRDAITAAIAVAKPGDMVLITGLGHEQYRVVDGVKVPWRDQQIVQEALKEL